MGMQCPVPKQRLMKVHCACPCGNCQRLRVNAVCAVGKGLWSACRAQIGAALASSDASEAERHMGVWLSSVRSWLHSAAAAPHEAPSG